MRHISAKLVFPVVLLGLLLSQAATAASLDTPHPFILWTKDEAAAIRRRIETEPWAKRQYEAMLKEKGLGETFRNLFRYQVMGDESVVESEKKYLVGLIGNEPRKFLGDTGGGRHYDQYLSVLRYDVLYDRLSDVERRGLEATFRDFIKHHCHEENLKFTRSSWLPNMQWPRPMTCISWRSRSATRSSSANAFIRPAVGNTSSTITWPTASSMARSSANSTR